MSYILPYEKIGNNARLQLEGICYSIEKFSQQHKYNFFDTLTFVMAKSGYCKYNYIPVDNDDLFYLSQKSIKYMKVYALRPEQFIQSLLNLYEQIKISGYKIDVNQTQLQEDYLHDS